jgi:hypothetical protein
MQRSFGTEISGNWRPGVELSDIQRVGILSAVEAGEKKTKIAAKYRVSVTDALSTMSRLLGEELEAASWLMEARARMEPVKPCDED